MVCLSGNQSFFDELGIVSRLQADPSTTATTQNRRLLLNFVLLTIPQTHSPKTEQRGKYSLARQSVIRSKADIDANRWIVSSVLPSKNKSVLVGPGEVELTVMPRVPTSLANTRVNCSTAALLLQL